MSQKQKEEEKKSIDKTPESLVQALSDSLFVDWWDSEYTERKEWSTYQYNDASSRLNMFRRCRNDTELELYEIES